MVKTIEVAPKMSIQAPAPRRHTTCEMVKVGPDLYKAVPKTRDEFVRLTAASVETLGLGISYRSLLRLVSSGFVQGQKVTPQIWQFSLDSYYDHVRRCVDDPDFWSKDHPDQNLKKYTSVIR